jgi:DNA-binding beta-propeller fold protein YncE
MLSLSWCSSGALAQDGSDGFKWDTLATVKVGSALAVGPRGMLYLADAGNHTVRILNRDGLLVDEFGGPGTGDGQFDGPSDIDPTNGLVIVVADLGNSRIQRFTKTLQIIESIPLYAAGPQGRETPTSSSPGLELGSLSALIPGRPVSVAVSATNETFAVDETAGRLARWDASRRFSGFVGDDEGESALVSPVAVEIMDDQVFVADNGRGEVVVFDTFGSYIRSMGSGALTRTRSISVVEASVWIVEPDRILIYSANGRREDQLNLQLSAEAVAANRMNDYTYVLTKRQLLRTASLEIRP